MSYWSWAWNWIKTDKSFHETLLIMSPGICLMISSFLLFLITGNKQFMIILFLLAVLLTPLILVVSFSYDNYKNDMEKKKT